jgi:hypothetical protein
MQEFEQDNYFNELINFYEEVKEKTKEEENILYSKNIYTKLHENIFKKNKFNLNNFDKYFFKLSDTEKYNFANYLISHDLIKFSPLDIRARLGEFFFNNEDYIYKILLQHKSYFKYYEESKSVRILFHCKEYYIIYLSECDFKDNEFKNKIITLLKN